MKRRQYLSLLLLSIILLRPISGTMNVLGLPAPSYVSIEEGDEIIWEVDIDKTNLDNVANDVYNGVTEAYDYLGADPEGLEDFMEQFIPDEYLSMNLTSALCELLYNLPDTLNSSLIPDLWL
ncbi:MAG: hypothetical protein EU548_06810, partial [Promethearchaeota archaeon]